ncbi:MAG: type II toxin-antitoxin system Phd/YefM family antitoxin [Ilumatobacteraceae bacterium]
MAREQRLGHDCHMKRISASDARRRFDALLDAVESSGESFAIVRKGVAVALLRPAHSALRTSTRRGATVKGLLRKRRGDDGWSAELSALRSELPLRVFAQ